ncbi:MAG: D-hexose-6-phosphate mutarotase [Limisphaerales bacterium]
MKKLDNEIPGHVAIVNNPGGLPKIKITTAFSTAEIYLHGAHVTGFQKIGEPPLLFMSAKSLFAPDKAIRGGVPICFPWFGSREGLPAHGFARVTAWELETTKLLSDGGVSIRLRLPENAGGMNAFRGKAEYIVTVGEQLTLELQVTNTTAEPLSFEECLHAYFSVGDINDVAITGLKGVSYLDKTGNNARKLESGDAIKIVSETDRVFLDTASTVEIRDAKLGRRICVEKTNSFSTVVWNPWAAKVRAMSDFGDEEYKHMVCVEVGNVGQSQVMLAPGKTSSLKAVLSSGPI